MLGAGAVGSDHLLLAATTQKDEVRAALESVEVGRSRFCRIGSEWVESAPAENAGDYAVLGACVLQNI